MRKITALLAVVVAITGCDKLEKALGNGPVGRYQMVTSVGANTFILDTRSGGVWRFSENRFFPVTVETTGMSPEDKRALLKSMKAQLQATRVKLAIKKLQKGKPLSPEELEALKKFTANE